MSFEVVSLRQLLDNYETREIITQLNDFASINDDVESFLKKKAIQFEKVGLSRTTLVYTSIKGDLKLAGYFAISSKPLTISKKNWNKLSNGVRRKLLPMGYRTEQDNYEVSSILLGQLGVNFKYKSSHIITGNELLALSYEEIKKAWMASGGTMLYLEAKNIPYLREFYTSNGFSQLLLKESDEDKVPSIPYVSVNHLHLYVKKLTDI
ncbi:MULTISPECIES: GNAT family acetyltransferase [Levilactobacillus]|uniref:GNAT family acetyltransferase n=1 Tax=Levilactobacillus TaxID=2767886 RepID=UPI00194252B0|nr:MULTISPECIES: GNAT family acetyltransferase [Levilactobacillus]MCU0199852.1 GNAT family acetyltransferase [Levilactobacillus brevis]